ncbi:hypothetical protein GCM10010174_07530 [Kutzneria viridogrisea]|uniref:Uncharacterized protein n=2 Tax=Kutzneria TaxID=43356 RepID=W5W8R5_9PSEU|nr:hypothetical protein [Kutzneria albida]AHH97528.1 hypothetical protein KALB_4164 [Kutzneria albida DSM 43870]MBA8930534.1 hypothetical protein [Kutzneria viridogrisea]
MRRWTRKQRAWLVAQVRRAPMLSQEPPWLLEFDGRAIDLVDHGGHERHDSAGLDRLLSCGTTLAELVCALQGMGFQAEIEFDPDPLRSDLVARVVPHRVTSPALPDCLRTARLELVTDQQQTASLARLLLDVSRQLDGDRRCAAEIAPWHKPSVQALVPARTRRLVPPYDDAVRAVAARLFAHPMIIVVTDGDDRRDHVLAGAAMGLAERQVRQQGVRLRPVIRPMHLREIRLRLMAELRLDGVPQAMFGVER